MVLKVQNDTGTIDGANSYATVQEATNILTDLGRETAWNAVTPERQESALVSARVYLDTNYYFPAPKLTRDQSTLFPLNGLLDRDGYEVEGIFNKLKLANALLALEDLAGSLYVNQRVTAGAASGTFVSERKVGPIVRKFSESSGTASTVTESKFSEVDAILAEFTDSDNEVIV